MTYLDILAFFLQADLANPLRFIPRERIKTLTRHAVTGMARQADYLYHGSDDTGFLH